MGEFHAFWVWDECVLLRMVALPLSSAVQAEVTVVELRREFGAAIVHGDGWELSRCVVCGHLYAAFAPRALEEWVEAWHFWMGLV